MIDDLLRFEVLKRSNFRCYSCGISSNEVKLQVDHIQPVSLGGTNELSNLRACCASCNIGKGAIPLTEQAAAPSLAEQVAILEKEEYLAQRRDELFAKKQARLMKEVEQIRQCWMGLWPDSPIDAERAFKEENAKAWCDKIGRARVLDLLSKAMSLYKVTIEGDTIELAHWKILCRLCWNECAARNQYGGNAALSTTSTANEFDGEGSRV